MLIPCPEQCEDGYVYRDYTGMSSRHRCETCEGRGEIEVDEDYRDADGPDIEPSSEHATTSEE